LTPDDPEPLVAAAPVEEVAFEFPDESEQAAAANRGMTIDATKNRWPRLLRQPGMLISLRLYGAASRVGRWSRRTAAGDREQMRGKIADISVVQNGVLPKLDSSLQFGGSSDS
jgi:hypothetical protein